VIELVRGRSNNDVDDVVVCVSLGEGVREGGKMVFSEGVLGVDVLIRLIYDYNKHKLSNQN
jgi:hypothetical protein